MGTDKQTLASMSFRYYYSWRGFADVTIKRLRFQTQDIVDRSSCFFDSRQEPQNWRVEWHRYSPLCFVKHDNCFVKVAKNLPMLYNPQKRVYVLHSMLESVAEAVLDWLRADRQYVGQCSYKFSCDFVQYFVLLTTTFFHSFTPSSLYRSSRSCIVYSLHLL